jgi:hypothetical protein
LVCRPGSISSGVIPAPRARQIRTCGLPSPRNRLILRLRWSRGGGRCGGAGRVSRCANGFGWCWRGQSLTPRNRRLNGTPGLSIPVPKRWKISVHLPAPLRGRPDMWADAEEQTRTSANPTGHRTPRCEGRPADWARGAFPATRRCSTKTRDHTLSELHAPGAVAAIRSADLLPACSSATTVVGHTPACKDWPSRDSPRHALTWQSARVSRPASSS